jgi:hypothetical protein
VLAGKRHPRAILPVAFSQDKKGAKGWRAMVVDGEVQTDEQGQAWFVAKQITMLRHANAA